MSLKALDIFKLTPKKNCQDCGFQTCMAFCIKVALGGIEVSKCPYISYDKISKLSESKIPLMKNLKVGIGSCEYELGGETVLFRHEKKLINKTRYAVAFDDSMTNEQIDLKIDNIKMVNYTRINEEMKVEMVVLQYHDNKEGFMNLLNRVNQSELDVTYIILCENIDMSKEAIEILKDKKPIICGANKKNYKEMVRLVEKNKLPLGVKGDNLEELYEIIESIQELGYRELLLDVTGESIKDTFTNTVQVRRLALKEQDRTFAYPSIVFANKLSNNNPQMEVALSSMFTIKYASIIVIDDIDYSKALPLFGLRQNIYADSQKSISVESKIYPINNADENSPVMITVDFGLTYFIVKDNIEKSKVPIYLAILDTGGYSVLNALSVDKLNGSIIAKFIKENKVEEITNNRDLIIPGKVAILKSDIEKKLQGWNIVIGTEEAIEIPKFLKEYKTEKDKALENL